MKRAGRSMYRKLYWLPLAGLFALFLLVSAVSAGARPSSEPPSAGLPFLLLAIGWAIFGRRVAFWLVPLFVTSFQCPGCREKMSTVGVWDCGCGFRSHRRSNILSKRCPKCGNIASHLDCPRCNSTILLW